ncbi:MAG: hypothetical protein V4591_02985 [Bdellovibrionota bacterium]
MRILKKMYLVLFYLYFSSFFCIKSYALQNESKTDQFIGVWSYSDGVDTYHLSVRPSNSPGYDYYLHYEMRYGAWDETSLCKKESETFFSCDGEESVTLAEDHFSVTLRSIALFGSTLVFYAPGHQPSVLP